MKRITMTTTTAIWKTRSTTTTTSSKTTQTTTTDPSNEIIQLNKDLLAVEDALDTSFQPQKIQYVFEGVSHLVAAILISSAATIKKINSNGVKKMCRNIFAVQHTLTASITGRRELALDHAKAFYELFNLTPKELLTSIVERGAVFKELDYMNAPQLLHRYTLILLFFL